MDDFRFTFAILDQNETGRKGVRRVREVRQVREVRGVRGARLSPDPEP